MPPRNPGFVSETLLLLSQMLQREQRDWSHLERKIWPLERNKEGRTGEPGRTPLKAGLGFRMRRVKSLQIYPHFCGAFYKQWDS